MQKSRNDVYTTMKFITLFLVVFSHCTQMYSGTGVFDFPATADQKWITDFLYVFHMPVFMFASGAIYKKCIQAGKYQSFPKFVSNKALRLLVPYVLIGLLCVSPTVTMLGLWDGSVWSHFLHGILLAQDKQHLWYLLVLFIYMLAIRTVKPLLDWSELFSVAAFLLAIPLNLFSRGAAHLFFVVYFMMGYVFEAYPQLKAWMEKLWYLFPVFTVITGLNLRIVSPVAGILAMYQICWKIGPWLSKSHWYDHFAKNSMGIYLLHPMMIYWMYAWIRDWQVAPWLATAVIFVLAMVLSDLLTVLCQKAKLGFFIGEK